MTSNGGSLEPRRKSPWSGNSAQRAELRSQVWAMRLTGYTHRQIGPALGISDKFSWTLEQEQLEVTSWSEREAMRHQQEERLGTTIRESWAKYQATGDLKALDTYRWAEERMAKLMGLDAPVKVNMDAQVTVQDGADAELAEMLAEAKMEWSRDDAPRD